MKNFKVVVKNIRCGQRKLDFILDGVRGFRLDAAQKNIMFSRKKNAAVVLSAIKSCMANMENNHGIHDFNSFYIKEAHTGTGLRIKRFVPRARGRIYPVVKTHSHFTLVVARKEEK